MTAGRTVRAYVSLGSNLGERARSLGDARSLLIAEPRVRLVSCSATIETDQKLKNQRFQRIAMPAR